MAPILRIEEDILDRLDRIMRLLMFQATEEQSITEGARRLKLLGFDNKTIAGVLNTTEGTVRTVTANLSRIAKTSKRKK